MLEKEVMQSVRKRLEVYSQTGEIEWWERLNSGKVRIGGHFIQMARKGTPDFVAILRNKSKNLSIIFLECKSETGQLRTDQKLFMEKYISRKDFSYWVIKNPKQVDLIINTIAIDRTTELPEAIG